MRDTISLDHVELAKTYCKRFHAGEMRKDNVTPYWKHPFEIARILSKYGYDDPLTQCIAYLHDAVEKSSENMDEIQDVFGYEVSNGVYVLSRNKGKIAEGRKLRREEYMQRLDFARKKIQRVKIADMVDNTRDLHNLSDEGARRKIKEAEDFYIPLGSRVAPVMVLELVANIREETVRI